MQRIETEVCIVGGGPAGMMLGYLLARAGADVTVLEKHADFLRDFRGDTIHPSTLGLLGELGLREEFLALPHSEVRSLDAVVSGIRLHAVDFARLGPPDDVLVFMPQWDFLDFVARKAAAFPNFHLRVATPATGLLRDSGSGSSGGSGEADAAPVTGVAATGPDGDLEIVAGLTVAADGRSSTVRAAAGLEPRAFGVAVDVLWFALPRPQREPRSTLAYLDRQSFVVTIDRRDHFQAGVVIPKGRFAAVRERGLEAFRRDFAATAKPFAGVIGAITDWQQVKLLDVQIARLDTWHRPGLLCIGDAAHAMSPAFGVGVNYAIQDAVATANALVAARARGVRDLDSTLAAVQARRLPPVRAMQALQRAVHANIARPREHPLLSSPPTARQRVVLRLLVPLMQRVLPGLVGRGFRPEHLSPALRAAFRDAPS